MLCLSTPQNLKNGMPQEGIFLKYKKDDTFLKGYPFKYDIYFMETTFFFIKAYA